jgi:hypothetical protein
MREQPGRFERAFLFRSRSRGLELADRKNRERKHYSEHGPGRRQADTTDKDLAEKLTTRDYRQGKQHRNRSRISRPRPRRLLHAATSQTVRP